MMTFENRENSIFNEHLFFPVPTTHAYILEERSLLLRWYLRAVSYCTCAFEALFVFSVYGVYVCHICKHGLMMHV